MRFRPRFPNWKKEVGQNAALGADLNGNAICRVRRRSGETGVYCAADRGICTGELPWQVLTNARTEIDIQIRHRRRGNQQVGGYGRLHQRQGRRTPRIRFIGQHGDAAAAQLTLKILSERFENLLRPACPLKRLRELKQPIDPAGLGSEPLNGFPCLLAITPFPTDQQRSRYHPGSNDRCILNVLDPCESQGCRKTSCRS